MSIYYECICILVVFVIKLHLYLTLAQFVIFYKFSLKEIIQKSKCLMN